MGFKILNNIKTKRIEICIAHVIQYKLVPLAGVFLARGVIGANGGGISVGAFFVGVEGTLEGRVPALGFLRGGSTFSSLLNMAFLA